MLNITDPSSWELLASISTLSLTPAPATSGSHLLPVQSGRLPAELTTGTTAQSPPPTSPTGPSSRSTTGPAACPASSQATLAALQASAPLTRHLLRRLTSLDSPS